MTSRIIFSYSLIRPFIKHLYFAEICCQFSFSLLFPTSAYWRCFRFLCHSLTRTGRLPALSGPQLRPQLGSRDSPDPRSRSQSRPSVSVSVPTLGLGLSPDPQSQSQSRPSVSVSVPTLSLSLSLDPQSQSQSRPSVSVSVPTLGLSLSPDPQSQSQSRPSVSVSVAVSASASRPTGRRPLVDTTARCESRFRHRNFVWGGETRDAAPGPPMEIGRRRGATAGRAVKPDKLHICAAAVTPRRDVVMWGRIAMTWLHTGCCGPSHLTAAETVSWSVFR